MATRDAIESLHKFLMIQKLISLCESQLIPPREFTFLKAAKSFFMLHVVLLIATDSVT